MINLITSFTTPSTVPTLSVAQNRTFIHSDTFVGGYGSEMASHGLSHLAQPHLSPRLHSLPDNVLSPLGLLAEASLQGTPKGAAQQAAAAAGGMNGGAAGRASPLSLGDPRSQPRPGSMNRVTTSDVRGDKPEEGDDGTGERGVASQNYFRPVGVGIHVGPPDNRVSDLPAIEKQADEEVAGALDYRDEGGDHGVVHNIL